MGNNTVVTDGEKLKAIRKKYRLKQSDLSGTDITRNLLSEIETGKAIITKNVAEIVIKNLKNISRKKGFKVTETVEYLTENTLVQAKKILDDYIMELKRLLITKDKSFVETLKYTKDFLADWNINEKATAIYELAGDYYYINNDMYESILYYEKTLTSIGKLLPSDELLQVFFKITKAYIHAGNYDKAIENSTFVIEHFDNLSKKDIIHFVYNRSLAFKKLSKFELAIADVDKIERLVSKDDLQNYFKILDTKAVCLCEIGKYDDALKLYDELLKITNNKQIDKKIVILINRAEVYMKLRDMNRATELLNSAEKNLPLINNNNHYESDIYYELGKIYRKNNNNIKAIECYLKALEISKKQRNYIFVAEVLCELMECGNDIERIDRIKNETFIISSKQEKLADKLIHKLINFYAGNKDISKVLEINNFALQFI